jgi:hypothetical protein
MSWVAVGIGGAAVVGGAVSYMGSQQAASGAMGAANMQANAASLARNQAMGYANATPQELNILGQQYQAASTNLSQQQQLMSSIDPALMEASKQALAIMQGGSGAATQPMFALRNQQRAQLVTSLQNQYGPGAESTAIGQQALQQFDMQTQNMQTGQLGNMMGMAESGGGPGLNNAINSLSQVSSGYNAIQSRQVNAALGTQQNMVNTAGAPYVGQTLGGQGMASLGNNVMNTGTSLGMMYGMKPAAPTGGSYANPAAGFQGQQLNQPQLGQSYSPMQGAGQTGYGM